MRSGQYKVSGVGSRITGTDGQFRATQHEFGDTNSASDYPHMNSLVLTMNKMADNRRMRHGPIKSGDTKITQNNLSDSNESQYEPEDPSQMDTESPETSEIMNKIANLRNSQKKILEKHLNKNCENLISPRTAVTKVEQRVKSLLHRGDSSRHKNDEANDHVENPPDSWQYGHLVTLPRRQRRSIVSSNYSLNDTASYMSGSSGYSSSSSSSYGSFKSCSSASSTLMRKKSITESLSESNCCRRGEDSPPFQSQPYSTLIDNPMYNITSTMASYTYETPSTVSNCDYPGSPSSLYSTVQENDNHVEHIYDIPDNEIQETIHSRRNVSLNCFEESGVDMEGFDFDDAHSMEDLGTEEDPVARECREYFERRLANSKDLKKRWSMCSSDSGAETTENDGPHQSLSQAATVPGMVNENTPSSITNEHSIIDQQPSIPSQSITSIDSSKKSPLDEKMDFLRKEITGLMKQDNALFRQLLTLHESIEALKFPPPQHPADPHTSNLNWSDLTEEEEEEDEKMKHLPVKNSLQEDTEDEGLEADRSLSLTPSPSSTLSSHAASTYATYSQREFNEEEEDMSENFSKLIKNYGNLANNYHVNKDEIFNNDYYEIIKHFNNKENDNNINHIDNRPFTSLYSTDKINLETSNVNLNYNDQMSSPVQRRTSILCSSDKIDLETSNVNLNYNDQMSSPAQRRTSLLSRFQNFSMRRNAAHKSHQDLSNFMGQITNRGSRSRSLDRCINQNQFARNRVSIPPTSRNRDRSARPESLRLTNDMASHSRILLKARSFSSSRTSGRILESPSPTRMNDNSLRDTQKMYQQQFENLPVIERLPVIESSPVKENKPVIKRRAPKPPKPLVKSLATKFTHLKKQSPENNSDKTAEIEQTIIEDKKEDVPNHVTIVDITSSSEYKSEESLITTEPLCVPVLQGNTHIQSQSIECNVSHSISENLSTNINENNHQSKYHQECINIYTDKNIKQQFKGSSFSSGSHTPHRPLSCTPPPIPPRRSPSKKFMASRSASFSNFNSTLLPSCHATVCCSQARYFQGIYNTLQHTLAQYSQNIPTDMQKKYIPVHTRSRSNPVTEVNYEAWNENTNLNSSKKSLDDQDFGKIAAVHFNALQYSNHGFQLKKNAEKQIAIVVKQKRTDEVFV